MKTVLFIIDFVRKHPIEVLTVILVLLVGLPLLFLTTFISIFIPKASYTNENNQANFEYVSNKFEIDSNKLLIYQDMKTKFDYDFEECTKEEITECAVDFVKEIKANIEYTVKKTTHYYEHYTDKLGIKRRRRRSRTKIYNKSKDVSITDEGEIKTILSNFDTSEQLNNYLERYIRSHVSDYIGSYNSIKKIKVKVEYEELQTLLDNLYPTYEDEFTKEEYEGIVSAKTMFVSSNYMDKQVVFPTEGTVTSPYGYRIDPIDNSRSFHNGIDIANVEGTEIKALESGVVIYAAYDNLNGNMVKIKHNNLKDNIVSVYLHTSKMIVKRGQKVDKGEVIALMGTTGRSTGSHLHFSIKKNGNFIDPTMYLEIKQEDTGDEKLEKKQQ